MKLKRIDLYHVSQRLVSPFVTSFGEQLERECLIVALHGDGLTGWGECVASRDPGYSYETVGTAWHILSDFLIPGALAATWEEPQELLAQLAFVRGHPLAKAALDLAAWDLAAQRDGVSLAEKLAQPYEEGARERVQVGVSIGIQDGLGATVRQMAHYVEDGYRRIKLKIKPGHDVDVARAARAAFPDLPLMLDANSAYELGDAPTLRQLDGLDLLMLEQPLGYEDFYLHSLLRKEIETPLCLDESIHSVSHLRAALALEACDIVNIKPGRVGGWTEARKVHDICREAGIPVWCGGMLETGIGRAGQLALASLPGFTLPGDISATARYYEVDITPPFFLNQEDSTITVPQGPGLGVTVDHEQLEAVTQRQRSFTQD